MTERPLTSVASDSPRARVAPRLIAPGCRVRPTGGERLEVEASFPFGAWHPRQASGRTLPGTPVVYDGRWWEVVTADTEGATWRYLLGPWPSDESIRAPAELNPETAAAARATFASARRREDIAWLLVLVSPLVGALPAADQERIESEFGIRATRATFLSALLGLGLGVGATLLLFMKSRGADIGPLAKILLLDTPLALAWVYLIPESIVRLGAGAPTGSLILSLPVAAAGVVWKAFTAARTGTLLPRPKSRGQDTLRRFAPGDPAAPRDGSGEPVALEIVTANERDDWVVGTTGIMVDGHTYLLVGRERGQSSSGAPGGRQGQAGWHYHLAEPDPAQTFRRVLAWSPEQARELEVALLRRERGLWVEPLAPAWGLLDEETQAALAEAYEYRPRSGTVASIVVTAVVGLASLLQLRAHIAMGAFAFDDIPLTALGIWCCVEVVLRTQAFQSGRSVPSAFAPLVAPLARVALRT